MRCRAVCVDSPLWLCRGVVGCAGRLYPWAAASSVWVWKARESSTWTPKCLITADDLITVLLMAIEGCEEGSEGRWPLAATYWPEVNES